VGFDSDLGGKVALITGGGGGLGSAICATLAEAGATVIAADVRHGRAGDVAAGVRERGGSAHALHLDLEDHRQAEAAFHRAAAEHGRLDILVNNAGADVTAPIEEISVADWDRILGVNLRGPFVLSRAAFPLMARQGGGQIVNIVSTAAKRAWANATAYHASKWALLGLSHALHVEGRPRDIKVTAIVSGGMRTPFLLDRFPDIDPSLLQDPRNVARTVLFVLTQPDETVIPEILVLPMRETSWP
jgi:NAD(P)-dependent dehydrogenase (short-subunit alcohol dehydrogenase family)